MKEDDRKQNTIAGRPEPVEGLSNCQNIEKITLEERIAQFDPTRHGGEVMISGLLGEEREPTER